VVKELLQRTFFRIVLILLGGCLLSTVVAVHAAEDSPSIVWSRTYAGIGMDSVQSVIQTRDGGFLLAGSSTLFGPSESVLCLAKLDALGNLLWNKTYLGTGNGLGQCVVQTGDGGFAVAGSFSGDFWLLKTDTNGSMQWNQTYHGTGVSMAHSLIQTSDEGFALAGATNFSSAGGGDECWLVKTDAAGNMQWNKTLYAGIANSLIQIDDGGYVVGCYGFVLLKANSSGDLQWSKSYGGEDKQNSYAVIQTSDGGYALGGWMWLRSDGGGPNIAIVKTDTEGNVVWNQTFGSGEAYSMTLTSDGGFAIAGVSLVKVDATGNLQWALNFPDNSATQAYSVIQTGDGDYSVAGSNAFAWLAKIGVVNASYTSQSPSSSPTASASPNPSSSMPELTFTAVLVLAAFITVAFFSKKFSGAHIKRKH
jgi:hypothetical protein